MPLLSRREFGLSLLAGSAVTAGFAGQAAAADKIRVGILSLVSHAPTFIAASKGYFDKQGLAAELVSFQAAAPVAAGIAAGDLDFSVTAITGGLISLADKGAVTVIGGSLQETQGIEGQKILVSKKAYDSGVTSPAKLKGRSFGMTTTGSSFHYMAHKIAQKEGFADTDIELKPLQKIPVIIAALKSGQIDAWSILPNIADRLTKDGQVVEIGKISDYAPNYQVTTVFTSTGNVAKRRDLVKRYIAAYSAGVADYNAALVDKTMSKEETAAIVGMVHKYVYASDPIEKADAQIRAGAMRISPNARLNLASVKDQFEWFLAEHMVPPDVTFDKLVNTGFVETD
ncbi:MAG TPA: ABC transporter substrate-binding protein [Stellaceae bacterium]|jgi:NitT/TauT family transport system substrate-binding protein|nr:ABC transporter substrate-binding protein [Stellaceae bacterium]